MCGGGGRWRCGGTWGDLRTRQDPPRAVRPRAHRRRSLPPASPTISSADGRSRRPARPAMASGGAIARAGADGAAPGPGGSGCAVRGASGCLMCGVRVASARDEPGAAVRVGSGCRLVSVWWVTEASGWVGRWGERGFCGSPQIGAERFQGGAQLACPLAHVLHSRRLPARPSRCAACGSKRGQGSLGRASLGAPLSRSNTNSEEPNGYVLEIARETRMEWKREGRTV